MSQGLECSTSQCVPLKNIGLTYDPSTYATFIIIYMAAKVTIKSHIVSQSDAFQRSVDGIIPLLKACSDLPISLYPIGKGQCSCKPGLPYLSDPSALSEPWQTSPVPAFAQHSLFPQPRSLSFHSFPLVKSLPKGDFLKKVCPTHSFSSCTSHPPYSVLFSAQHLYNALTYQRCAYVFNLVLTSLC